MSFVLFSLLHILFVYEPIFYSSFVLSLLFVTSLCAVMSSLCASEGREVERRFELNLENSISLHELSPRVEQTLHPDFLVRLLYSERGRILLSSLARAMSSFGQILLKVSLNSKHFTISRYFFCPTKPQFDQSLLLQRRANSTYHFHYSPSRRLSMKLAKLFNRNEETRRSKTTSSSDISSERTSCSGEDSKPLPQPPPDEDEAVSRLVSPSPCFFSRCDN